PRSPDATSGRARPVLPWRADVGCGFACEVAGGTALAASSAMAIVQALIAFVGRSFGRILSALFDWAVVAIFGYTTGTQKIFLSALLAAAGAWPLLLLGTIAPRFAAFVLAFVPIPESVPAGIIRIVWIAVAVVVPLGVGIAMAARQPEDRPKRPWPARLLRGFPITI